MTGAKIWHAFLPLSGPLCRLGATGGNRLFTSIPSVWDLSMRDLSTVDLLLGSANRALTVLRGVPHAAREYPSDATQTRADDADLSPEQRAESAALMRVNHVGEVCAQALYEAQAIGTRDAQLRAIFRAAANEELDHLAWT